MHLDFGCNDGRVINELTSSGMVEKAFGLDANENAINGSCYTSNQSIQLEVIKVGSNIPFEDNTFSSCSLFGVLEHIYDQSALLNELYRVIKPGGTFVIAVPGKHLFSFLDLGNWKFLFPRLHKFIFTISHSDEEYNQKYTENKFGLIGDIEAKKGWHEHFSRRHLKNILQSHGFIVNEIDGCGYFWRLIHNIQLLFPKPIKKLLTPIANLDKRLFSSSEIWAICSKK
jgi:SAM-dependent methyltransferase